jgi:hypothetical protein
VPTECGHTCLGPPRLTRHARLRRPRLCGRRIDWVINVIYTETVERYRIIDGQYELGLRRARDSFVVPPAVFGPANAPAAPTPAIYTPNVDVARTAPSAAQEEKRMAALMAKCREGAVPEAELASVLHTANRLLEMMLVQVAAAGRNKRKRAELSLNPDAVAGGSKKRTVKAGALVGAGQRVPDAAASCAPRCAPPLSKARGKAAVEAALRKLERKRVTIASLALANPTRSAGARAASQIVAKLAAMSVAREQMRNGSHAPVYGPPNAPLALPPAAKGKARAAAPKRAAPKAPQAGGAKRARAVSP